MEFRKKEATSTDMGVDYNPLPFYDFDFRFFGCAFAKVKTKLVTTQTGAYWIVAVKPAGDEGKAVDPNLYAPASQLPLS